jgi:hypothetical protein
MTNPPKKILLKVSYEDTSGKFWQDSSINNKIFDVIGNIHETVGNAMNEEDGVSVSYKGKPIGNIFQDTEEEAKAVGYIYRVKSEIYDDTMGKTQLVFLNAWVEIKSVSDYPIIKLI